MSERRPTAGGSRPPGAGTRQPPGSASSRPAATTRSKPTKSTGSRSGSPAPSPAPRGLDTGLFVVLLLIVFAVSAQTIQYTFQLDRARTALNNQIAQQSVTLNEAQKVRAQLEAIAGDTAALAEAGNQNAIQLRDFLAQKGVTIRPPASP